MSQINIGKFIGILLLTASLSACGDASTNSQVSQTMPHPSGWTTSHKSANLASCVECHGEDLGGGISRISCMSPTAVSGFICHATNPVNNPVGCISCHGADPYGPYGSTAPNRKFAHSKHTLLIPACKSCHPNAGSGTPNHARATATGGVRSAFVHITSSYKAKSYLSYGYNQSTGTCSGVSCHGGQDSPVWSSGTIAMVTDCLLCHQQGANKYDPQYNSFYSGNYSLVSPPLNLHTSHIGRGALCTDCHNIGILTDYAKHFSGIGINNFTNPGATIGGGFPTKVGNYDTVQQKCSNTTCHTSNFPGIWNQ
ncbi:MAG: CxxxxCH/CxxCH domain-containing protein [Geobacteraceae bacterium]|nr:CxxxxCH/CxxCH domain-containing protein [Geobacteraceae bacterium]